MGAQEHPHRYIQHMGGFEGEDGKMRGDELSKRLKELQKFRDMDTPTVPYREG